ncbi:AAA family ATPase, partial [Escherichia coli]
MGEGKILSRAIEADKLTSAIFYGPPGTGKTTLAKIIANTTNNNFTTLNAVTSGIKDIKEKISFAVDELSIYNKKTILFIDEIHRFNKAQQDALL